MTDKKDRILEIEGKIIKFQIHNDKRLKNTYLQVKNDILIIKSRNINVSYAEELIKRKIDWVVKAFENSSIKTEKKESIKEFKTVRYLGIDYETQIIEQSITKDISIYFNEKFLVFVNPKYINDKDFILDGIYEFYRKRAEKEIPQRIYEWSRIMQLKPNKITFKKLRKRWGSCSHDNNLNFNIKIMALNKKQIDYVIIHEIAHIAQKNHSRAFWDIVKKYMPDYKDIHDLTLKEVV